MRMFRPSFVSVALLFGLSACNGPKEDCQGSMDSYYSLLKGHNWDGVYELLTPEQKKKLVSAEKIAAVMAPAWDPTHSFSMKINQVVETGLLCVASGALGYTYKVRGALPEVTEDEYFSWTFRKQSDGKWYIELPGAEKIQSW